MIDESAFKIMAEKIPVYLQPKVRKWIDAYEGAQIYNNEQTGNIPASVEHLIQRTSK